MTGLPNALRCPDCGQVFLVDLLGEGVSADEVAAKKAAHDRQEHGA